VIGGLFECLGDIGSDLLSDLFEWFMERLPRPVRMGCWTILGLGLAGLVGWLTFFAH